MFKNLFLYLCFFFCPLFSIDYRLINNVGAVAVTCLINRMHFAYINSKPDNKIFLSKDDYTFFQNESQRFLDDEDVTRLSGVILMKNHLKDKWSAFFEFHMPNIGVDVVASLCQSFASPLRYAFVIPIKLVCHFFLRAPEKKMSIPSKDKTILEKLLYSPFIVSYVQKMLRGNDPSCQGYLDKLYPYYLLVKKFKNQEMKVNQLVNEYSGVDLKILPSKLKKVYTFLKKDIDKLYKNHIIVIEQFKEELINIDLKYDEIRQSAKDLNFFNDKYKFLNAIYDCLKNQNTSYIYQMSMALRESKAVINDKENNHKKLEVIEETTKQALLLLEAVNKIQKKLEKDEKDKKRILDFLYSNRLSLPKKTEIESYKYKKNFTISDMNTLSKKIDENADSLEQLIKNIKILEDMSPSIFDLRAKIQRHETELIDESERSDVLRARNERLLAEVKRVKGDVELLKGFIDIENINAPFLQEKIKNIEEELKRIYIHN